MNKAGTTYTLEPSTCGYMLARTTAARTGIAHIDAAIWILLHKTRQTIAARHAAAGATHGVVAGEGATRIRHLATIDTRVADVSTAASHHTRRFNARRSAGAHKRRIIFGTRAGTTNRRIDGRAIVGTRTALAKGAKIRNDDFVVEENHIGVLNKTTILIQFNIGRECKIKIEKSEAQEVLGSH